MPTQWRHVPGDVNPADDASRGIPASSLSSRHRWFQGPAFLKLSADCWPAVVAIGNPDPADPEVTLFRWIGSITTKRPHRIYQLTTEVSDFNRLVGIVGWLLRFVRNYPVGAEKTGLRYLSAQEIRSSTELIITVDQHNFFYRELATIRSKKPIPGGSLLAAVNPQVDVSGLMRVSGRIIRSEVSEPTKRPIVLHHDSHLARLIVRDVHRRFLHASCERVLKEVRAIYYITCARSLVRRELKSCVICKKMTGRPVVPIMAPLPTNRTVTHLPPFHVTGIDYFGPFTVVFRRKTHKIWGAMFTCLNCRAIHLEHANSLETESFLMALERFSDRRGSPTIVYSDNGTNLTAGEKELQECL